MKSFDSNKAELIEDTTEDRRCTDIPCCLIFLAFIGVLLYVLAIGASEGNPGRLYRGINYNGKVCGVDFGVIDKPYLFWPTSPDPPFEVDLDTPVCISSCPTQEDVDAGMTVNYPSRKTISNDDTHTITTAVDSTPVAVYASKPFLHSYCEPLNTNLAHHVTKGASSHFRQFQEAMAGVGTAWPVLVGALGVTILLCFIYGSMLRFCVGALVITVSIVSTVSLFLIGIGLIEAGKKYAIIFLKRVFAGTYGLTTDYLQASLQSDSKIWY
eukprot:GHVL01026873.1.p1 GENE.GHVL01026873.1~~GHVL01026873.1.p1  ORF type:complete len:269 (+),score=23.97 GHVL01026873.1:153-959(+)